VPLKRRRGYGPFSSARAFPPFLSRWFSTARSKSLSPIFLASPARRLASFSLTKAFLRRSPLRVLCTRPGRARARALFYTPNVIQRWSSLRGAFRLFPRGALLATRFRPLARSRPVQTLRDVVVTVYACLAAENRAAREREREIVLAL